MILRLFTLVWRYNDQYSCGTVQRLRANQPRQAIQSDLFISRPRGGCRHFELHDCKVSGVILYSASICTLHLCLILDFHLQFWKSNSNRILTGGEFVKFTCAIDDTIPGPAYANNCCGRSVNIPVGSSGWIQLR